MKGAPGAGNGPARASILRSRISKAQSAIVAERRRIASAEGIIDSHRKRVQAASSNISKLHGKIELARMELSAYSTGMRRLRAA